MEIFEFRVYNEPTFGTWQLLPLFFCNLLLLGPAKTANLRRNAHPGNRRQPRARLPFSIVNDGLVVGRRWEPRLAAHLIVYVRTDVDGNDAAHYMSRHISFVVQSTYVGRCRMSVTVVCLAN